MINMQRRYRIIFIGSLVVLALALGTNLYFNLEPFGWVLIMASSFISFTNVCICRFYYKELYYYALRGNGLLIVLLLSIIFVELILNISKLESSL